MNLEGANINKTNIIKEEESREGDKNYYYAHCSNGIYNVKGYGKVTIKNIYPGIDWVLYTNLKSKGHPLKYDFVIHSGSDYKAIKIKFLNAQIISLLDDKTKLKIETIAGNIEEGKLFSYLNNENEQQEIKSKYLLNNDSLIAFEIEDYDKTKTLIIDPLVWATYYGGSSIDYFNSICTDSLNNIYLTGCTYSVNFPTQQFSGAYWQNILEGSYDIFILKFNSQGVRQWATYYGGTDIDVGKSICIDSQENIYVTGYSGSSNIPTQQMTGAYWQAVCAGNVDLFI